MKIKNKKSERIGRMLAEASVNFVSVVDHPANQAPFKILKNAEDPEVVITEAESDITRPTTNSDTMLGKIEFISDTSFEQAQKYAEEYGFEAYTIVPDTKGHSHYIKSTQATDQQIESARPVLSMDNKARWFLIGPESEKVISKSEKEVIKMEYELLVDGMTSPELLSKFDSWIAYYTNQETLGEALNEAMYDGIPPGMYEIMQAYYSVVATSVLNNNPDAIIAATDELGQLLKDLVSLFQKYYGTLQKSEGSERNKNMNLNELAKKVFSKVNQLDEATEIKKADEVEGEAAEETTAEAITEEVVEETVTEVTEEATEEVAAEAEEATDEVEAEVVEKSNSLEERFELLAKALEARDLQIEALTKSNNDLVAANAGYKMQSRVEEVADEEAVARTENTVKKTDKDAAWENRILKDTLSI